MGCPEPAPSSECWLTRGRSSGPISYLKLFTLFYQYSPRLALVCVFLLCLLFPLKLRHLPFFLYYNIVYVYKICNLIAFNWIWFLIPSKRPERDFYPCLHAICFETKSFSLCHFLWVQPYLSSPWQGCGHWWCGLVCPFIMRWSTTEILFNARFCISCLGYRNG